jgi:hypothetical protein
MRGGYVAVGFHNSSMVPGVVKESAFWFWKFEGANYPYAGSPVLQGTNTGLSVRVNDLALWSLCSKSNFSEAETEHFYLTSTGVPLATFCASSQASQFAVRTQPWLALRPI